MRGLAGITGVVVLLLALAVGVAMTSASPDKRGSKTVKVADDFYSPDSVSVSKGTKVKFKWVGNHKHNVVKTKGPGGAFSSTATSADGVNFKHKFSKSGTYKIICTIHPEMTMKVKVN
jgi:plastocyanin